MSRHFCALLSVLAVLALWSCSSTRRLPAVLTAKDSLAAATGDSLYIAVGDTLTHFGFVGPRPDTGTRATNDTGAITATALPPSLQHELLQTLARYAVPDAGWNTFSGRAKVHFEGGGQSHDFVANIRMERGKTIWISATALLNLEVARLLITPDTLWMLDRLSRTAQALPFAQINQLLPLQTDFNSLQSLLLGGPLQTNAIPMQALDTGATLLLLSRGPAATQALRFSKADTSLMLQYIATAGSSMLCEYGGVSRLSGHRFPAVRNLQLNAAGADYRLTMEFVKADYDVPIDLPFSIPGSYQKKP